VGIYRVSQGKIKQSKKCLPEWAFLFSKQPALDPGEILLDKVEIFLPVFEMCPI
jgi:hypothetical protein